MCGITVSRYLDCPHIHWSAQNCEECRSLDEADDDVYRLARFFLVGSVFWGEFFRSAKNFKFERDMSKCPGNNFATTPYEPKPKIGRCDQEPDRREGLCHGNNGKFTALFYDPCKDKMVLVDDGRFGQSWFHEFTKGNRWLGEFKGDGKDKQLLENESPRLMPKGFSMGNK